MNQYEIKYEHHDMPKNYVVKKTIWSRDHKAALSAFLKGKPDKQGFAITKKGGASIRILSVKKTMYVDE